MGGAMLERILVERAKSGDARAAEKLVRGNYPAVLRFLKHLTWGHPDAADLAQMTFLRARDGLQSFRFENNFGGWLHQIAYREYIRWLKKRKSNVSLESAGDQVAPEVSEGLLVLADAFGDLDEGLREVFLLREVEQHSVAEVSRILCIPAGTVKSRLSRAKSMLRARLSGLAPQHMETRYETTR